jgi:hypothetical protein
MALLFVGFAPVTARAFDVPGSGDDSKKKKKKKDDKKDDAKKDDTAAGGGDANMAKDDSKSDSAAASKDNSGGGKTNADNNPPPMPPARTTEVKVPKSLWDAAYMKEIKVGDFLEYEMPAAPGMRTHMEVVEYGDHTMTQLSRTIMNGKPINEGKSKMIYSEPDPETGKVTEEQKKKYETKTFDDKVKIGDKGEYAATRTETYEDGKLVAKMWTCKDVPLGGLVKSEGPDGKSYQVLVNFGRGK